MERLCCLFMNVIRETFFYHLRELTPDCGVSIRTSRTIHEYSLRKPWKRYASFVSVATIYTNTKYSCKATGVKSRSQVPRRNAKGMPSKLAASHQGHSWKKLYVSFISSQIIISTVTLHVFGVPTRVSNLSAH